MKHKILPSPKTVQYGEALRTLMPTYYCEGFDGSEKAAMMAASDYFDRVFSRFLSRADKREDAGIVCICDAALGENAYVIDANDGGVTIHA